MTRPDVAGVRAKAEKARTGHWVAGWSGLSPDDLLALLDMIPLAPGDAVERVLTMTDEEAGALMHRVFCGCSGGPSSHSLEVQAIRAAELQKILAALAARHFQAVKKGKA